MMGKLTNLSIILLSMKRVIPNLRLFINYSPSVNNMPEPTQPKQKLFFRQTLKGTYSENQFFLQPITKTLGIEPRGMCMGASIHH